MRPKIGKFEILGRRKSVPFSDLSSEDDDSMSYVITEVSQKQAEDFLIRTVDATDDEVRARRKVCSDLWLSLKDEPEAYLSGPRLRNAP